MRTYHKPVIAGTLCAAVAMLSPLAGRAAAQCVGDCNGDGAVTIDELIVGVNIALGSAPLDSCPVFDVDGSQEVEVNELILGVLNALNGCPDLRIFFFNPPTTPPVGSSVTFFVEVDNGGPTSTGVTARFQVPAGYTLTGGGPQVGTYDGATGDWIIGSLPAGGLARLILSATVNATGPYDLTATITGSSQQDTNTANNTATATVTPNTNADLRIFFFNPPTTPPVGSSVSLFVEVDNGGPASTTGITARFQVPAGYTLTGGGPQVGSYDSATGVWTIGALPAGNLARLILSATVTPMGPYDLTAAITGSSAPDPNPANNTVTAVVAPNTIADLSISFFNPPTTPPLGSSVSLFVEVDNGGPASTTGITARFQVPAGYTLTGGGPQVGSYDSATGVWTIGALPAENLARLILSATVTPMGPYDLTAAITGSSAPDPNPANNTVTAVVTPNTIAELSRSFFNPPADTLFAAPAIVSTVAADVRAAGACVGDCNADGAVTINELIVGVNMALGTAPQNQCPNFDIDLSGTVTVNELITAVNGALNGCPPDTAGVLLQGPADMLAVDATVDMPPVAVEESAIQDGIIMTRLDLHLAPGATVGEVNAALVLVNGGVVTMRRGHSTLTIAIPRPTDLNALANVVQTLRAAPGISWTAIARVADPKVLPPSPAGDTLSQLQPLLPTRFPAAWNASHVATNGCAGRKVSVLVADTFQRPPLTGPYAQFFDEIPIDNFRLFGGPGPSFDITHGYDVTTTLAALFDASNPTGANPFADCLQIEALQVGGLTEFQKWDLITLSFPTGKFLLNYSQGYSDKLSQTLIDACTTTACTVMQVEKEIDLPVTRAYSGAEWILLTSSRWDDFLAFVAAGNEKNEPGTAIYSGLGVAVFDSGMSVATLLPDDSFLSDGFSWNATLPFPGFPKLTAGSADVGAFHLYTQALGVDTAGPAANVLMVGSTTAGATFDALVESPFSDSSPDLFAVGEQIFALGGFDEGTSFAAPQVAGLASYLWLLSPDLRSQPASATREAILANVRGVGVIDAYASALSLDAAALPTVANAPVRLAILDVNDDGKFDETDLDTFLNKFFTGDETQQDYSRFDLNGDGFTGGSATERFDLDRVGSTKFGTTAYSTVTQSIEGEDISFDEHQLTDLQILCYYAYSALYTGDPDMRTQLTAGHCTISVTVDPAAVTLAPGASQQFSATVRGTADPRVTWQVDEGGGSISDTGLFTAGQSEGTATVRASSVVDPKASGHATVTVSAVPLVLVGQLDQTYDLSRPDAADSCNFNEGHGSVSAFVKAQVMANGDIVIIEATGSRTVTFNGTCPCNGCPPEHLLPLVDLTLAATTSGTITGGEWQGNGDHGLLILTGTLTQTRQAPDFCDCTVVDPGTVITQDVANLKGTPVLQAGRLVAIDFNSTTNSSGETTVTTGRLQ